MSNGIYKFIKKIAQEKKREKHDILLELNQIENLFSIPLTRKKYMSENKKK